ncbi:MAG TPA: SufD family Fe-S cluster assembly protein, partial [Bacilli bacterium]|nr:SufD family Fe-S cluster assembly protein [Bacilli bacterium]
AKTISLPMLLCHEEDVDGSHGVSTGKVDINKLFYIMTRGLSYEDALKLIINGKFNSIINKIPDEVTKQFITDEINKL